MFILSLTYKVPLEAVDGQMQPHMAWVKKGYDDGVFVASGRKVPRTGGVILAVGDRDDIEKRCADDPFAVHDIADYAITEVAFTTVKEGFEILQA